MSTSALLAVLSGSLVGFLLGLLGGGGSIVAVPLLLYVVGVTDPHVAIGTSAVAVAANALLNVVPHAFAGHVRWRAAVWFALVGVVGAAIGSTLGKQVDGQRLLVLFALLMVIIAALMQRAAPVPVPVPSGTTTAPRVPWRVLGGTGLAAGALSGFFGVGGGFLIVPGLRLATRMPMVEAIGSSLVAVSAFSLTTAINYALSGLVRWPVAGEFVAGGLAGGYAGARLAHYLSHSRMVLHRLFGAALVAVALYMLAHALR